MNFDLSKRIEQDPGLVGAPMRHFVTIRLEYREYRLGHRTPWKRRGRCTCGWQCLSWDGLRAILISAEHARERNQTR